MPLPNLCLAPYEVRELQPDEPLCACATARVCVESGVHAGNYLLRKFDDGNGSNSLVARNESPDSSLIYIINTENFDGRAIGDKIAQGDFYRHLYFDSNGRLMTSVGSYQFCLHIYNESAVNWHLRAGGSVNIRRVDEGVNNRCGVDWKFDTPAHEIEHDILRLLSDENSYFAFANRWEQLDYKAMGRRLLLFANGSFSELKHWLCALVYWMEECDADMEWHLSFSIGMRRDFQSDDDYLDAIAGSLKFRSRKGKPWPSMRDSTALKALLRHFYPCRNADLTDLLDSHDMMYHGRGQAFSINIIVPISTAHERLEARLQLRDFLRDKVSPADLADLMGEF